MMYKAILLGLGQIGLGDDLGLDSQEFIFTHARSFTEHPDFELIAAIDIEQSRRDIFQKHYSCPVYADIKRALTQHEPDVVIIATPTDIHLQALQQVLDIVTPRIILCEKPLAYELSDAYKIVQLCKDSRVRLFVNYMRRSDEGVLEIKKRLAISKIETPIKGIAWYTKGFFHNGSHLFNLLEYWLGPVQDAQVIREGRMWDNSDPEPDIHIRFENGEMAFFSAWEEKFSHYAIELMSPSGRLRYEHGGEQIFWQDAHPDPCYAGYTMLSEKAEQITSGMKRYQWHVTRQLAKALGGHEAFLCSGEDALSTLSNMHKLINRQAK